MTGYRKLKAVAAAVGACAAMMATGSAHAYVYGMSHLEIKDLVIFIDESTDTTTAINSFLFSLSNSASMPGQAIPSASSASCGSSPFPGCAAFPAPPLDAVAVNGTGSVPTRTENDFSFLGTGVTSYSGADSIIKTAQLVDGVPTSTEQIAEALLNTNGIAQANTNIQSTTTITLTLTVVNDGADMAISFLADPDQRSQIAGLPGVYSAQTGMAVSFSLTRNGGGGSVTWAPDGDTTSNNCFDSGAPTCIELVDDQNLNTGTTTAVNPSTDDQSFEAALAYGSHGVFISGLTAGTYSLAITANTSVLIARQVVPEPGSLALIGLALSGLGLAARRRRQTA